MHITKANFKVQPDKYEFYKKEVAFLGFTVSQDGIKPSPDKVIGISDYPEPSNLKELQLFLGLSSYYRRFIMDYAKIARPLTKMLKGYDGNSQISKYQSKKFPVKFNSEQKETFVRLKNISTSEDVLIYPDFKKEFNLTTDASDYEIGAVLSQGQIGKNRPITFISRALAPCEEHYAANEKEILAIIWALDKLKKLLVYSKNQHINGPSTINFFNGSEEQQC